MIGGDYARPISIRWYERHGYFRVLHFSSKTQRADKI
ncbi:MAG: hypothetical protein K0Q55_3215 [Verrucomicrobia bacterium]|jgi:hypothetical protein|nr:hypothetical protein [Verrucomicrobiota bacterium]